MRFLADESLERAAVEAVRSLGHDVAWIMEDQPSLPDEDVLARANATGRILITADKGFGDLVFARGLPATPGVILLRINTGADADTRAAILAAAIQTRDDWPGRFSVIDSRLIRIIPLPPTAKPTSD